MSTLKDVARLAGVNISTISRYLSGKLKVTPTTEKRIQLAIQEIGYKPNLIAQSLRSGASNLIGVVVPDIYQPGISGIVYGIDEFIEETRFALTVLMSKTQAKRELQALEQLRNMMVTGVIVIGHPLDETNPNHLLRETLGSHIHLTLISRNFVYSDIPEICPDQTNGACLVTSHLLERGYRKIGMIISRREHPDAIRKIYGYHHSMSLQGIEVRDEWIAEGFYDANKTRQAAEQLVKAGVEAIFCTSDEMAIYTIQHLHQQGISIPGQVAVAGYGGASWSQIFTPRLTTVVVKVEEIGRLAAETLIHLITGSAAPRNLLTQPVSLQTGETT